MTQRLFYKENNNTVRYCDKIDTYILSDTVKELENRLFTVSDSAIKLNDSAKSEPTNEESSGDWANLVTIAAQLEVLPKSISGAASRRGRDIGDDTIEFEVSGRIIRKKGSGLKALYQVL